MKKMNSAAAFFIAIFAWCGVALAQGGPAGPGPVPDPWLVNGPTISYSNGGLAIPQTVTGGGKGIGTINVSGGYYVNGVLQTGLTAIASHNLVCNLTGGSAIPTQCSWTAFADVAIGNTNGNLPYRTGGSWGTISTGTSGGTIPLNNTANTFSAAQVISLNSGTPPAAIATAGLNVAGADGTVGRIQVSSFGSISAVTGAYYGGTAASPTQTLSGTQLTGFNAHAYTGSALVGPIASYRIYAAENITATAWGSKACIGTTPATTAAIADSLCQQASGGVTIGIGATDQGIGTLNLLGALYNNGTAPSGTGAYLRGTAPSMSSPVITTAFTATGLVKNADLVSPTITINSTSCTLGASCTISASAGSITVGTTLIGSGTDKRILYDNAGTLGEYSVSGTGTTIPTTTGPTITGGAFTGITALGIRSTGAAFDMTIANTEVLTAGRTLTITLNDAARTINLGGNITLGGAFTTTPANGVTLTTTGATNVTLPVSGTLATLAGTEALTNKTVNGLTITTTTGTLTIASGKTLTYNNSITIGGTDATTMTMPTTSATIARTDAGQTFTGTQAFATITASSTITITSASASAVAVGLNGATNPAFVVDSSTASQAAGLKVTGAATGGTVAIAAIDSGSNTNLTINGKGTGTIGIGSVSTGAVTITPALTLGSTINKITLTAPATAATLTIADNKTHVVNNSITLAGTDATTWTGASVNMTLAALNIQGQVLAGGATVTSLSLSTGSLTVDCGARPLQYITGSTSAWSFTAPAADGSCMILLTNAGASAVIPSFSGFTVGSNTGGTLTSTASSKFTVQFWRINGTSAYTIFAHQ